MRPLTGILTLVVFIPTLAFARLEAGAGLSLAWPQGEFKDYVEFAWGGGGRMGWAFGGREAVGGAALFADINYLNYGRERRAEPFSYTIPDVWVDVVTDNYMLMVSPGVQVGLWKGPVRPYGEFFGGFTYIATRTKVENQSLPNERIAVSTNFDDFTYNIGFGGGIQFLVWHVDIPGRITALREALIDIKFNYIKTGEAEYLKKGGIIRYNNGTIEYDVIESKIEMFQMRIGAAFRF